MVQQSRLRPTASSCPTAWKTEGKAKGRLIRNGADPLNIKELVYSTVVIARKLIVACMNIGFIDIVAAPKWARLVPAATMITGINKTRMARGEV